MSMFSKIKNSMGSLDIDSDNLNIQTMIMFLIPVTGNLLKFIDRDREKF
jgi:hypothetical protein